MKTAIIILALLLAGCATNPPPQKVQYIIVPTTVGGGSGDPVQDYIAQRIHDDQLRMRIEDDDFDTMMGMRAFPYPY